MSLFVQVTVDVLSPFSTCYYMLDTLVINGCYLRNDSKVLLIFNSKLSSLPIDSYSGDGVNKIALSTLNLSSLGMGCVMHKLSVCKLPFLEWWDNCIDGEAR